MRLKFLVTPLKQIIALYSEDLKPLEPSELPEFYNYIKALEKIRKKVLKRGVKEILRYVFDKDPLVDQVFNF